MRGCACTQLRGNCGPDIYNAGVTGPASSGTVAPLGQCTTFASSTPLGCLSSCSPAMTICCLEEKVWEAALRSRWSLVYCQATCVRFIMALWPYLCMGTPGALQTVFMASMCHYSHAHISQMLPIITAVVHLVPVQCLLTKAAKPL